MTTQEAVPQQVAVVPQQTPAEKFVSELAFTREELRQIVGMLGRSGRAVSERTLYRMEKRGELPLCTPISNQKCYLKTSVEAWLRGREEQPRQPQGRHRPRPRRGGGAR